ncbi:restriction endonuclease subunit S [Micromonospora sp. NPDC004540]|uniref:restriction endonuclease subunit S n=1 Tax=Micromonospora sp. NPDC004540 TaxID=3154457 RepID=UPI0033A184BC
MTTAPATASLGDVASFIRGITFKPDDVVPLDTPGSVLCMRTKNVQADLDLSDVWAVDATLVKRREQFLEAGDILVSSANSWNLVGKCCWVSGLPTAASFGGFISTLRADSTKIDARYLYHWFASPRTQTTVRSFGQKTTNISNLNFERCLKLTIPLPPLEEQRRIAEVLDRADELRAKRREALAHLGDLTQSIFLEMFSDPIKNPQGYDVRPLIEWVDQRRPITYGILKPGENTDNGPKYVRVVDMKNGEIDLTDIRRTSSEISAQYRRSLLRGGDLLMSIRGHVGRMATIPDSLDGANITQDSARLAVDPRSSYYVMECMRTPALQRWMERRTKGAAVQGINLADVKAIPVPQPPLALQQDFRDRAMAVEALKRMHRQSLNELDALFASLQDRAFRGLL